ncbi:hemin degrading factor [Marinomonas ushuaiensis DSM 15871]|uniref:Hemin degrading factor n=1 Tax=Marinomonas ushuaiensis DSM 15871 TaxID=1122207 RepID=X7E464_9GAMM|nr:hemin-degrading factor [Marinomonas ushuaiensis]ETX09931.1 hemin degrading factor [Marinomonas ushuaiensis DSM 15871]
MPLQSKFDRSDVETELAQKYQQYVAENPKARRRDIAEVLNISEAALLDAQAGVQSIRLKNEVKEIIEALPTLGYVMTLMRNDNAVHERKGIYQNIKINGAMGLIIADDRKIDLRLFLSRWKHVFAIKESTNSGDRYSLQFFDGQGVAIQKIFLQPDSDVQAYEALLDLHTETDQTSPLVFSAVEEKPASTNTDKVDQKALIEDWSNITNVHQFMGLLKHHNVTREQAFKLVGKKYAEPFTPSKLEDVLNKASQGAIPIMCFVGNNGGIQIHTGVVNKIVTMGDWLNVLDPEFNLHLLMSGVASAWVVRKPTTDGNITSLELYDKNSDQIAQFFGQRTEGELENTQWKALAESVLA